MKNFNLKPIKDIQLSKYHDMRGYVEVELTENGCGGIGHSLLRMANLNETDYQLFGFKFSFFDSGFYCTLFVVDKQKYPEYLGSYDQIDVIEKHVDDPLSFDQISPYMGTLAGVVMIPSNIELNINIISE